MAHSGIEQAAPCRKRLLCLEHTLGLAALAEKNSRLGWFDFFVGGNDGLCKKIMDIPRSNNNNCNQKVIPLSPKIVSHCSVQKPRSKGSQSFPGRLFGRSEFLATYRPHSEGGTLQFFWVPWFFWPNILEDDLQQNWHVAGSSDWVLLLRAHVNCGCFAKKHRGTR